MCSRENGMDPEVANQVAPEEPPGSMSQLEWEEAVRAKDEHIDLLKASVSAPLGLQGLDHRILYTNQLQCSLAVYCNVLTLLLCVA